MHRMTPGTGGRKCGRGMAAIVNATGDVEDDNCRRVYKQAGSTT